MTPADLLQSSRAAAGLSVRGLAQRAGVSASTVSRVEAERMDPTVGMLSRLLAAAGFTLVVDVRPEPEIALQPSAVVLADLTDAWQETSAGYRPDFTRLRAFLDHLAQEPGRVAVAVSRAPESSGSAVMDALLAAIAEKIADDAGLERPGWTRAVPGLREPWQTPGTPRMQEAARRATPPQLLSRGLVVDAGSLWRELGPPRA